MDNLICEKKVDWSLLKEGFTLPKKSYSLLRKLTSLPLAIGDKHPITIIINGTSFSALLTNPSFDKTKYPNHKEHIQIRYTINSEISQYFKEIFRTSYKFISAQKKSQAKRLGVKTPEPEIFRLYISDKPDTFIGETIVASTSDINTDFQNNLEFDKALFQQVLAAYKAVFVRKQWPEEKYKWIAVKHFQDNWDIDAPDFAAMLKNALAKTGNLLVSVNNFPARMITEFAEVAPEQVRAMFKELFDETLDIGLRVKSFKEKSQPLLDIHGRNAKNHYQGENTIFTYLWLRYPEKYYIYKISELKTVAETLHSNLVFQNGKYEDNIRNFLEFYDAIRQELLKDDELKTLLKSQLTDDCYADDALCTLTIDFGFYISRRYNNANNEAEISEQTDEYSSEEQQQALTYYSRKDFLSNVFITADKYDSLVRMLKAKKNIILQGAPGVGKTFAAKRLAYSIMGEKDDSRIEFVQFHQNYSYEDFVMGYKPDENSFELRKGIFYSFCQKAASAPEKDYFFIIDEINRGNMSKIFGELLMLIEKDYRGTPLTLAYNGLPFSVPKNLYIIGMMNTADRSLAMIDYALRRRFSFFDMEPGFDSEGFSAYQKDLNSEKLDKLVNEIKELNREITEDKSLGKGFCIGHSYLCGAETCSDEWLQGVAEFDIVPMLAEYWFDESDKYEKWKKRLMDAVK